jgi:hypothetical protein
MPIHPLARLMKLSGVTVAYRGSEQPQLVDIRVQIKSKSPVAIARLNLRYLVDAINAGAAGGAESAPTVGSAKLVKGSFKGTEPDATGPKFAWTLELAGVSPKFVRVLVEQLSMAGGARLPVQSMSIVGKLAPVARDPLSVREDTLIPSLDDADAYPAAWPDPGFEIAHTSIARGLTTTLALSRTPTPDLVETLEELLTLWATATTSYPNAAKKSSSMMTPMPAVTRKRSELTARWETFDAHPPPKLAILTNMLARFHREVCPIARVAYAHR